ncbi:MAG TPA: nucleotidyltransferase family protein [Pyrinomonadaceae bacterium]|nr:nucleotidyltransferase family protein [Pyrinomonadaceae bacterium]
MSIAAILLAAWQSRRMGAFKPLLPFGDATVAERCVSYLLEGGAERLVVVTGHRGEEVRRVLSHLPVKFAVNPEAESEMGRSIARGVEELPDETEAILVALVDQPAVPPDVPRALIHEWRRTGARLLVPEHAGRGGHPVLLDASLRAELLSLDGQGGLRALFDRHRQEVLRVRVESPYIARDMDTWDDYRALFREVFGAEPPAVDTRTA